MSSNTPNVSGSSDGGSFSKHWMNQAVYGKHRSFDGVIADPLRDVSDVHHLYSKSLERSGHCQSANVSEFRPNIIGSTHIGIDFEEPPPLLNRRDRVLNSNASSKIDESSVILSSASKPQDTCSVLLTKESWVVIHTQYQAKVKTLNDEGMDISVIDRGDFVVVKFAPLGTNMNTNLVILQQRRNELIEMKDGLARRASPKSASGEGLTDYIIVGCDKWNVVQKERNNELNSLKIQYAFDIKVEHLSSGFIRICLRFKTKPKTTVKEIVVKFLDGIVVKGTCISKTDISENRTRYMHTNDNYYTKNAPTVTDQNPTKIINEHDSFRPRSDHLASYGSVHPSKQFTPYRDNLEHSGHTPNVKGSDIYAHMDDSSRHVIIPQEARRVLGDSYTTSEDSSSQSIPLHSRSGNSHLTGSTKSNRSFPGIVVSASKSEHDRGCLDCFKKMFDLK